MHCVVFGCKHKSGSEPGISFHSFPKDKKRTVQWLKNIHREDYKVKKHSKVCSRHFSPESFNRTLTIVKLRENATPTIVKTFPEILNVYFARSKDKEVTPEISQAASSLEGVPPPALELKDEPPDSPTRSHEEEEQHQEIQSYESERVPLSPITIKEEPIDPPSPDLELSSPFHEEVTTEISSPDSPPSLIKKEDPHLSPMLNDISRLRAEKSTQLDHPYSLPSSTAIKKKLRHQINLIENLAFRSNKYRWSLNNISKKKVSNLLKIVRELKSNGFLSEESLFVMDKMSNVPKSLFKRVGDHLGGDGPEISRSPELLAFAMTLAIYSKRAFNHVRRTYGLNLPTFDQIHNLYICPESNPGPSKSSDKKLKAKKKQKKRIASKKGLETKVK